MKHHQTNVLMAQLNKAKAPLWSRVAQELARPTRATRTVNVGKLSKLADERILLVPGKVLGMGTIDKPVTVIASSFSEQAQAKIKAAKGKTLSIEDAVKKHPEGKGIRIIG